jgi:hypothetical protein
MKFKLLSLMLLLILISGCGIMYPKWKSVQLSENDRKFAQIAQVEEDALRQMIAKPLYKFSEREIDVYLGYLQWIEPDLTARIQHLARKNIDQSYDIYLLGEFPVEIYDDQPLYSLKKSDCLVFTEHIYAMALSYDWESFFAMLQRIRYKNGEISLITRNHYTEYDWNVNNSWLVEDITDELAGDNVSDVVSIIDKARFFRKWDIGQMIPVDSLSWSYIPYEFVPEIIDQLQPGDFVNIVRGYSPSKCWVGHVGFITKSDNGIVNFLHSHKPKVSEEPLIRYIEDNVKYNEEKLMKNQEIMTFNEKMKISEKTEKSKRPLPYFYGFKFLRVREDPMWELIKIDGFDAPDVTIPSFY